MESGLHRPDLELADLYFQHNSCTRCGYHENRKRLCRGFGNPNADIVFVLDRLSPADLTGKNFPGGGPKKVIDLIFEYLDIAPETYYFAPPALCPSDLLLPTGGFKRRAELMPLHDKASLTACRPRLHEEIRIIEPEIIVALGTHALKALYPKNPPSLVPNLGRVMEVPIQGTLVPYATPVMVTYSLTTLYRTPVDLDPERTWEKAVSHIETAIGLANASRSYK